MLKWYSPQGEHLQGPSQECPSKTGKWMDRLMHSQEDGWIFRKVLSVMIKAIICMGERGARVEEISPPSCVWPNSLSAYSEWLPSCLHSGNAMELLWLGLPESALTSGIQPPADSLDPSFWPAAFSRAEKRKQHTPSWSLKPAHKSL